MFFFFEQKQEGDVSNAIGGVSLNKLEGFYELRDNGLPSVDWKEFCPDTKLDDTILWTIRSAVEKGDDLNLPRLVGANAHEAQAFAPIIVNLSAKYGKEFTVYALGNRFNKDTATAYVFANDDPTMLFTARVTTNGELEFEDYAYRNVCRKVERIVNSIFEEYGMDSECFANFWVMNNDIEANTSPSDYITQTNTQSVTIRIIVKSNNSVSGKNIEKVYNKLSEQISGLDVKTGLYVLSADDYDKVSESVKLETQVFDAYRLKVSGAEDEIKALDLQIVNDKLLVTADEIDAVLAKEVQR